MNFNPYPNYRASSSQFLGNIPEHWAEARLKFLSKVNMGQAPTSEECNQDGEGWPFLQGSGEFSVVSPKPKQWCISPPKFSRKGSWLVSVRAPVGDLNFSDITYGIGRGLCSIHPKSHVLDPAYLGHFLRHSQPALESVAKGSTYSAVSAEQVGDLHVSAPPLKEQQKIAQFLDYQTAKIDRLIEKQQRLLELLGEKWKALVFKSVTQGISSDFALRDTEVQWLGKIPKHWEVKPLRRSWRVIDCKHKTPTYIEGGYPLVSTTEIKPGYLDLSWVTREVSEGDFLDMTEGRLPRTGDIVYSRNASLGAASYVSNDDLFCLGQDVVMITSDFPDNKFLFYQLNSEVVRRQAECESVGSTFKRINVEQIGNFLVAVPPYSEQRDIAKWLDQERTKYNFLENQAARAINLLKEHRKALISAAVTGKIDVREWEPPETESEDSGPAEALNG